MKKVQNIFLHVIYSEPMLSTYINTEKKIAVYNKDYMNEFVYYKLSDNLELSF